MTSEENQPAEPSAEATTAARRKKRSKHSHRVLLVPYPKFVFMYPTLIISVVTAFVLQFAGFQAVDPDADTLPVVMTGVFLVVLMANMFVLVFDFPRATSLTLVFIIVSLGLGFWMLVLTRPDLLPSISGWIQSVHPAANAAFYWCFSGAMILMYIAVLVSVRFNYWELSNNELLHHHGFLSDLKRYPAPNLRVDKEINDVFEFMLLGAGRLILHPSTEKRAIVLENVLFVGDKEQRLTQMLGSIKVEMRSDSGMEKLR
jgi:hypothetical protein